MSMNSLCLQASVALLFSAGQIARCEVTPQQIIESKTDILGETALKQPGGPSYNSSKRFCRRCAMWMRRTNIIRSCWRPASLVKGKFLGNGGIINPLARRYQWVGEAGIPWHVTLGPRHLPFGEDLAKLKGPHFADGYLPIVQLEYTSDDGKYGEECFASTDPELAAAGAIFVRFDFPGADRGRIDVEMESGHAAFDRGREQCDWSLIRPKKFDSPTTKIWNGVRQTTS